MPATALTSSYQEVTFWSDARFLMAASTSYHLVLQYAGAADPSNYVQIALLIAAAFCFRWAWKVEQPYGGDAGLGDAIAKLGGYAVTALLVTIVAIWFLVQHIQFR